MSILKNPYPYQLCTASQSREMDRRTIEEFGIDGFTLMETAGIQAARVIANQQLERAENQQREGVSVRNRRRPAVTVNSEPPPQFRGLFICGKGNNGGDALVAARYLALHHHHHCTIFLLEGENELSPDSSKNVSLLGKMAENGANIDFINGPEMPDRTGSGGIGRWGYLVDGLLGTGMTSAPRPPCDKAIEWINAQSLPCYAIDIPTGLNADSGLVMGMAVRASCTLSFGARKLGFYLNDGPEMCGEVHQLNLSFPDHLRETSATLVIPEIADQLEPVLRRSAKHKYSEGVVYIIAGSDGLTGAAIMAALSAWKTGVGAVFLFSPRGLLDVYEKALPEIIKIPMGESDSTHFTKNDAGTILQALEKHPGTLLAGPGVGRNEETFELIRKVLSSFKGNVIIDADALYATDPANRPDSASWILTPHPGELARVTGFTGDNSLDRLAHVKQYSYQQGFTLVSKGDPTIIGTPEGDGYVTGYDTRLFSRAGFGDVLSGKLSGFLAITGNPTLSTLHGMLDGFNKASQRLTETPNSSIEPKDLI